MGLFGDIFTVWAKDMRVWSKKPFVVLSRALIFPLVYLVIFANSFGDSFYDLPIAVVDLNAGPASLSFVSAMTTGNTVRVVAQPSYEKALELFKARKVYAIVIIPKGAAEVSLLADQSSPQTAGAIISVVNAAAARLSSAPGSAGAPPIIVRTDVHYGRGASYMDFLTPGVIIQTIAMGALFSGGVSLLFEKQLGVFNLLLVAPIDKMAIIMGKILSAVTQSMASGLIALVIAFLLGAKIKAGVVGILFLILLMFLVSFCFIGLGIAMTAYISDFQAWMMTMQLIIMPFWIVSGTFFPIESMAWWLRPLALVSPLTYATSAARNIMIRGFTFASVSSDFAVLAGMAAFMFLFGIKSFRRTVE